MTDVFALIAAERRRLAAELSGVAASQWDEPSLCAGWDLHTVAAHLNAPWAVSMSTAMWAVIRHGGITKGFNQIALDLAARLEPAACVAGLIEHADNRFVPPLSPPTAPLTDVIVHGADMLLPLDRAVSVAPEAAELMFRWLCGGRAKGFLPRSRVTGLCFVATDLDVRSGDGPEEVIGDSLAISLALTGRTIGLESLEGSGVNTLAGRLRPR